MSSNQENQDRTTSPNTNTNEGAVRRKKTRPNQRKRKQIALQKAQLKETETALLTEDIGKKNVPIILSSKTSLTKKHTPTNQCSTDKSPSTTFSEAIANSNSRANKTSNSVPVEQTLSTNSQNISQKKTLQPNNCIDYKKQAEKATQNMSAAPADTHPAASGKTREEIMAEREAKKMAKQAKKAKPTTESQIPLIEPLVVTVANPPHQQNTVATIDTNALNVDKLAGIEKTRDQIKAEREAKKKAKQAQKVSKTAGLPELTAQLENAKITDNSEATGQNREVQREQIKQQTQEPEKKKATISKAERRAIQEAQRAAKSQALAQKNNLTKQSKSTSCSAKQANQSITPDKAAMKLPHKSGTLTSPAKIARPKSPRSNDCKVRLFNHLEKARHEASLFLNNPNIHPSIARLGVQYAQRTVVGSNARCIAFLNALKMVIKDFETPPKKEFTRSLETKITNSVEHLQNCRPLAVSVSNAYKHIKHILTQLPTDQSDSDLKENLCRFIDTYIENQIGKAAEAISYSVQEKISDGDVILTFGCSSLITYIFEEAQRRRVNFRVIIVDSRPFCEGQELLRRLTAKEIPCSYVLINAVSFVMPEATKVLLGAHALLANGYVMARSGTAQVVLVAHSFNVPVLVCCETHKFSERSQTDAIVYNELGNPDDLIRSDKCSLTNWKTKGKMVPLNLMYDITPPELVTAVVTEVSILPCTSVPVILRIKPTEIGY
ncbi:translation initiation factor eIF2B subunit delta isoform X2 [Eurosta solidaginis]|uniref:translation initiation factor eIF2B subunit delta isoform X2 n=1 Tax=Eurosta solidaginis TaxID=178769 RepID=UPI00353152E6